MGDDQREHIFHGKLHLMPFEAVSAARISPLKQPAIHQQCPLRGNLQPMATAGYAIRTTVVDQREGASMHGVAPQRDGMTLSYKGQKCVRSVDLEMAAKWSILALAVLFEFEREMSASKAHLIGAGMTGARSFAHQTFGR